MKPFARVSVLALLLALPLWTLTTAAPADAKEVVIRAIAAWPLSCDCDLMYKKYIERVNERGKGVVKVRLLGGPEVAPAFEQFQALRTGIADMTHSAGSYYAGETIEGAAMSLVKPDDIYKWLEALRKTEAMKIINEAYAKKSATRFVGILVGGTGFRFLMAKPIAHLDDLKGKRIRASGAQDARAIQHLGGSPQTIPANELYTALQRGVVDGAYRAPNDAWSFGERDVYKAMIATPMQLSPGGVYIATRVWDKLPEAAKKVLSETAEGMEREVLDYYYNADQASIKKLQANGMKLIQVDDAGKKRLAAARNAYWADLLKQSPEYGPRIQKALAPYN
ncbi:MAG: TRAP transporter substrate-binding protein DctP [Deltaproteobacteria bacterium]|nr:TRAP transporter substrate-binding protein DctP [Deltaproteobacteria bacterium]